jgi:DNA-3-methyladenine glycosylase II
MLRLVLEQQVSLASADAAYRKLEDAIGDIEPGSFLDLDDDRLKAIGFSRQKTEYVRGFASGLVDGSIEFDVLADLPDEDVAERLTAIRGVGPWTAACYLLFALRRPDVWPPGDRALHLSMGRVFGLPSVPATDQANSRALTWRPFRAVAARLLWHEYLGVAGER